MVQPNGSKYWRLKYRFLSKEKVLALGVYPETSLAEARQGAQNAKAQLKNNIDPSAVRRDERIKLKQLAGDSFKVIAEEFVDKRTQEDIKPNTLKKVCWLLEEKLFPSLGHLPVKDVTPIVLLDCLKKIERL